jgi:hypothetical protein
MTMLEPRLFPCGQDTYTSDDYYTPAWVFERMGIDFDLDVCAPPGGIPWIPAARFFTQEDDGLAQPWEGRVWMNPPFSSSRPWTDRFLTHRNGVALLPLMGTGWCDRLFEEIDGLLLLPSRIQFATTHKRSKSAVGRVMWQTALVAFGDECVEAIGRLGKVRR